MPCLYNSYDRESPRLCRTRGELLCAEPPEPTKKGRPACRTALSLQRVFSENVPYLMRIILLSTSLPFALRR